VIQFKLRQPGNIRSGPIVEVSDDRKLPGPIDEEGLLSRDHLDSLYFSIPGFVEPGPLFDPPTKKQMFDRVRDDSFPAGMGDSASGFLQDETLVWCRQKDPTPFGLLDQIFKIVCGFEAKQGQFEAILP
jgi:hypothetical protein